MIISVLTIFSLFNLLYKYAPGQAFGSGGGFGGGGRGGMEVAPRFNIHDNKGVLFIILFVCT